MGKFTRLSEAFADTILKDGYYRDIRDLLERINKFIPDKQVFGDLDRNNELRFHTVREVYEDVMNLGDGLIAQGLKDAHIAMVSDNCLKYIIADISVSSGVGVFVPIDADAPVESLELLLEKSDADAVMCAARCLDRVVEACGKCPRVKEIITVDSKVEGHLFYDDILENGKALKDKSVYRSIKLEADAPAKILFTSGTTGANKGVVLSNVNLAANIRNNFDVIMGKCDDTSMSVLPFHHATEINCHIMTRLGLGQLTYINGSMRTMMTNIKIFKPTCITIVPMIANMFHKSIWAGATKAGKADKLKKGIGLSRILRKFGIDRTHEMFKDVFEPFGGNLNMIVCGGAMLNPFVVKGMSDLGVRMENGYGITECGPLISLNGDPLDEYRSVGKPCPSFNVKIESRSVDGVGELCVKGPSVFKGYYKDEEATAQVFDDEGYFHTGDIAYLDGQGRLILVGRKKNTIILDSGKNISPEEVENIIEVHLDYVTDVVVYAAKYGDTQKRVLCAGLYVKDEEKRRQRDAIARDIQMINKILPTYKNISYVELPDEEYPKTSSRKVKRTSLPVKCSGNGIKIY